MDRERTLFEVFLGFVVVISAVLLLLYCCTVMPFVSMPMFLSRRRRPQKDRVRVFTLRSSADKSYHLRPNSVIVDPEEVRNGIAVYENQSFDLDEIIRKDGEEAAVPLPPTDKIEERGRF